MDKLGDNAVSVYGPTCDAACAAAVNAYRAMAKMFIDKNDDIE